MLMRRGAYRNGPPHGVDGTRCILRGCERSDEQDRNKTNEPAAHKTSSWIKLSGILAYRRQTRTEWLRRFSLPGFQLSAHCYRLKARPRQDSIPHSPTPQQV